MDTKILGNMIRKGPEQVVPTDIFFLYRCKMAKPPQTLFESLQKAEKSKRLKQGALTMKRGVLTRVRIWSRI